MGLTPGRSVGSCGGRELPIIGQTACALADERSACLAVDITDAIAKPAPSTNQLP
jgi:hypothetical protein